MTNNSIGNIPRIRDPKDLHLAGTDANTLHKLLLDGKKFDVPNIDFEGIKIPDMPDFSKLPDKVDIEELTTRQFAGSGVFDAIMESVYNHIDKEFQDGRITANEYTKQYAQMLEASLSNAVQFALQKDTAYWQGITAQMQAISARVQLEITIQEAKARLASLQYDALLKEAQFTNTKMNTLGAESTYQISEYNLNSMLPTNKNLIEEQIEVQVAQTLEERTDGRPVKGSVGKNKDLITAQIQAFKDDAQYKIGKLHSDTWTAMRSTDEDLLPPSVFRNEDIAGVIANLKRNVDLQ